MIAERWGGSVCGNPADDSKTDYYQGQDVVNTCLSMMYCNDDDGDVDENDDQEDKEKEGEEGYEDGKKGKDEERRAHRGVFFIEF